MAGARPTRYPRRRQRPPRRRDDALAGLGIRADLAGSGGRDDALASLGMRADLAGSGARDDALASLGMRADLDSVRERRMDAVTSTRNTRVKAAAALSRRRERRRTGRHLAEGPHAVAEALAAGAVETLFLTPDARGEASSTAPPDDVEVIEVADHVLTHLADTTTPQGVVAVARDVTVELSALPAHGLVVVLDGLADPGNVGGIVRTADAAGASAVVCTRGCADVLGPKAVRAAAGSTYHVPLVTEVDVDRVAETTRAQGRRLLGLDAGGTRSVLEPGAGEGPVALVLGNEAHGLAEATRDLLDELVRVPMWGAAESLNVAAAAAVAIYATAARLAGDAWPGSGDSR